MNGASEGTRLSIVVPVLNEVAVIVSTLEHLQALRIAGAEVIVVDGGSTDDTPQLVQPMADRVVQASTGRARQMNKGAALAGGDVLLFLHADTILPRDAGRRITEAISAGRQWGRFDVLIEGASPLFPVISFFMNLRSRLSGVATGDQAIFVARSAFVSVGGFPDIPLMEDIAFSDKMRRRSRPACIRARVRTSGRRWEKHGVARTILKMWWLRLRFFLGDSPERLAAEYGHVRR